jgi:DNA-binding response OmpR family regulator
MYKILIVEDHEALGYVLVEYLKLNSFETALVKTGEDGLIEFQKYNPHLCLVDVSLPGIDGFEFAQQVKRIQKEIPLIFLTARGLKIDRIKGLKLQADDYLVKPIDEEELVLRINSVLRRVYPETKRDQHNYKLGSLVFEPKNHLLKNGSNTVILTEKEAAILDTLCRHKEKLVNKNLIMREVWGNTDYFTSKTMAVHLSKIRKYLAADPSINILNVHGQGFILKEDK